MRDTLAEIRLLRARLAEGSPSPTPAHRARRTAGHKRSSGGARADSSARSGEGWQDDAARAGQERASPTPAQQQEPPSSLQQELRKVRATFSGIRKQAG